MNAVALFIGYAVMCTAGVLFAVAARNFGALAIATAEVREDRPCQDEPGKGAKGLSRWFASRPNAKQDARRVGGKEEG